MNTKTEKSINTIEIESAQPNTNRFIQKLAWFLDSSIPLPGGVRIGFDGVIGLFPVVGDAISAGLSSIVLGYSLKAGVPKTVLLRMMANILLDLVVGSIPLLGDIFDFTFKANSRNLRLLEKYNAKPEQVVSESRRAVYLFALGILALIILVIWLLTQWLQFLFGLF